MSDRQLDKTDEGASPTYAIPAKRSSVPEKKDVAIKIPEKDAEEKDDTDEKKDSEKPLLEKETPKEAKSSKDADFTDTPTLPLPSKKGKAPIAGDSTKDSSSSPAPSMFIHPFSRLKYEWHRSANLTEFFTRAICILFASVGWLMLVGGAPLLSIVQLVMGSIYINDCKADPRIPEYLIVAGFFGTILHIMALCTKYAPEDKKSAIQTYRRGCICVEAILQVFLFIWFIAGCVWVYSIFEPQYEMVEHEDYCHKTLYLFAFWSFNISFILIACIISIGLCSIMCVANIARNETASHA